MSEKPMKNNKLIERLRQDRPMIQITLRIPEDVLEDLKREDKIIAVAMAEMQEANA